MQCELRYLEKMINVINAFQIISYEISWSASVVIMVHNDLYKYVLSSLIKASQAFNIEVDHLTTNLNEKTTALNLNITNK